MHLSHHCLFGMFSVGSLVALGGPVGAVITVSSDATGQLVASRLTAEPTANAAAETGWKYEGTWGTAYCGTPIAANYFISAKHIGIGTGASFTYNGQTFTTDAVYDDPNSDLRISRINGTFGSWAQLYTEHNEVGKSMLVYGHGTQIGAPVVIDGKVHGWKWGATDTVKSWGQNTVAGVYNDPNGGPQLRYAFNSLGSATMSTGDSGGGVFIQQGDTLALAGINHGTDSIYSFHADGSDPFSAAIVDRHGLYVESRDANNNPVWISAEGTGAGYATRISDRLGWIEQVIGNPGLSPLALTEVPEPTSLGLLAIGGLLMIRRRR